MLIVGQRMMHTLLESTHCTTNWENGKQGQEFGPFLAHSLTLAIGSFIGDLDQIMIGTAGKNYNLIYGLIDRTIHSLMTSATPRPPTTILITQTGLGQLATTRIGRGKTLAPWGQSRHQELGVANSDFGWTN